MHQAAELDLLLFKEDAVSGTDAGSGSGANPPMPPRPLPSMRIALTDLKWNTLRVACPGTKRYPLGDKVDVVPLAELVAAG